MFISAPPTTMKIVSPKQTIAQLRHPENQILPLSTAMTKITHSGWVSSI